ncbi:DUF4145 domain-containing protein [Candidatus Amarolinea dominans]|uniref:DUF4145 domain-containing protein n=1 Tax=Candidatus Amarolinea dominans TaxID=3140696 RepID=UPI001DB8F8C1|nr:DUF4145 domain-containing protein [Anaerolineae bacterium]
MTRSTLLPKTKSIFCNSCKRETNHICIADHYHVDQDDDIPEEGEVTGFRLLICAGCENGTLEEYFAIYPLDEDGEVLADTIEYEARYYPDRGYLQIETKQFKRLPPKLDGIYREVLRAFNNDMGVLCAIGIRALIEGIVADREIENGNLEKKIESLSGLLPKNIVSNLHSIRFMGNEAAHELSAPARDELRLAIEICEDLLNYLYDLDYKASSLTEVRNKRKKQTPNA